MEQPENKNDIFAVILSLFLTALSLFRIISSGDGCCCWYGFGPAINLNTESGRRWLLS